VENLDLVLPWPEDLAYVLDNRIAIASVLILAQGRKLINLPQANDTEIGFFIGKAAFYFRTETLFYWWQGYIGHPVPIQLMHSFSGANSEAFREGKEERRIVRTAVW
jgi:hypothetical protein